MAFTVPIVTELTFT